MDQSAGTSTPRWRRRRGLALALAGIACGLAIAACGSSSQPGGAAPAADVAYANCMRAHGVPGFPDPGPDGFALPATINPQAPAFISAQKRCTKLTPGPIRTRRPTERQKLEAVAFSKCVRAHGLPDFPDPSLTVPPPPAAGGMVRGGMYWALGPGGLRSPAFRRAATACGWQVSAGVIAVG